MTSVPIISSPLKFHWASLITITTKLIKGAFVIVNFGSVLYRHRLNSAVSRNLISKPVRIILLRPISTIKGVDVKDASSRIANYSFIINHFDEWRREVQVLRKERSLCPFLVEIESYSYSSWVENSKMDNSINFSFGCQTPFPRLIVTVMILSKSIDSLWYLETETSIDWN